MTRPDGRPLRAGPIALRELTRADGVAVRDALDDDRVWAGGYLAAWGRPVTAADYARLAARLAVPGERIPYAVTLTAALAGLAPGTVVGLTAIGDIDMANRAAHIGWTAYAPAVWGQGVNAAAKLALLGHCFDDCGLERVKLQTDVINARSESAIAALGAVREGVLRHHVRRADGTWRDSVVYSILASEWPGVRARLHARLGLEPA